MSYLDILTKKVYLQPLLITMGVMITQQVKTRAIPCLRVKGTIHKGRRLRQGREG